MGMYPLKFQPILKQTLWGGERIVPFKRLHSSLTSVGESWELSGVKGNESVVAEGEYKGRSLAELVRQYKGTLVGEDNYARFGDTFPLLVKFIDARQDLSIQVHPNDEMAAREHGSMGKSEMWYVMNAEDGARLRCGFSGQITPEEYESRVADSTITEVLREYEVHPGDVFYLPAGRVHSLGAGTMVAEIQQTSDVTYRIFDFNRRDDRGNLRELHTALAAKAIDYTLLDDYRTHYEPQADAPVELVSSPYFTTTLYTLESELLCDYSDLDSFVIYVCLEGQCHIVADGGEAVSLVAGETLLLPASVQEVKIVPDGESCGVKFLETYV